MASDRYYRLAVKSSVAGLCQSVGWHGIQNGACDILGDVMVRYLKLLGRTAAQYTAYGGRTDIDTSDVLCAFESLDVNLKDLLEYFQNVDDLETSNSILPSLPVARTSHGSSSHVYCGVEQYVSRKRPVRVETEDGEGSSGECGDNEEEEEEQWEELPSYLPPLPQINKTNDKDDDIESGIHMTEDLDEVMAVTTPTSSKSPLFTGSAGLPSFSYTRRLSELDEENNSRSGSISGDPPATNNSGMAQAAVARFTSPPDTPTTPATKPPVMESPKSSDQSPMELPSEVMKESQKPKPSPTPISSSSSPSPSPSPKPPSPRPVPSPRLVQSSKTIPKPNLTIKIVDAEEDASSKTPLSLPPPLQEITTPSTTDITMPPLHLMSPPSAAVSSPIHSLPQLSSLHGTPPTSPLVMKPVRPVLYPLTSPLSRTASDNTIKPIVQQSVKDPTTAVNVTNVDTSVPVSDIPSIKQSLPTPTALLPISSTPLTSSSSATEILPQVTAVTETTPTKVTLAPPSPKEESLSPLSTPGTSDSSTVPSVSHTPPPPLPVPPTAVESDLYLSSSNSSSSSPASVKLLPPEEEDSYPLPTQLSVTPPMQSLMPPPTTVPYLESFDYKKEKSPLSNQEEEEEDDSSDSESSESIEYPVIAPSSTQYNLPTDNTIPLTTSHTLSTNVPSVIGKSLSPSPPKSLTVRINKSDILSIIKKDSLAPSIGGATSKSKDLKVSTSEYKKVDSILSSPQPLPPVPAPLAKGASKQQPVKDLVISSSKYQLVDSINPIAHSVNQSSLSPPTSLSLIVRISRSYLLPAKKDKSPSVSSEEVVKVTIPKSILTSSGLKIGGLSKKQGKKGRAKGRGQKRDMELPDVGAKPSKKIKRGSGSYSSTDDEDSSTPVLSYLESTGKKRKKSRSEDSESKEEDEPSVSSGLKLRLKLPQPDTSKRQSTSVSKAKRQTNSAASSAFKAAKSPKGPAVQPSSKQAKSETLVIKSSLPVKVPSIKVQKASSSILVTSSLSASTTSAAGGGPEVYICPLCERPDDGTPMICCDNCDVWLHMRCVGLTSAPPENTKWFCPSCSAKKNKKSKKR